MELKEYLQQPYQGGESFINKVIIPIFGEELFEDGYDEDMLESHPEHSKLAQQTSIKSIVRLGTIQVPFNETNVFDITVADKVQMEHNRVAIQLLVRSMMSTYSSAFMIFHYEDDDKWDWRFTFCSKGDNRKEMTESKRYSFLLGPNQSCRTAADNFQKLFQKHGNIELKDIETAFDVEALSKEFFGKYKEHYECFVEYITGKRFVKEKGKWVEKQTHEPHTQMYNDFGKDDKRVRNYIKKLLGRIVFLHFLQRKGWMNGDLNYMQNTFERSIYKNNYLDAVLEPLFFGILNTKPTEREDLFAFYDWNKSLLAEWEDIPYLNGGLFERDKDDEPKSVFPADYFKHLFQFFSEYNFTIDENDPNDAEVGVDPEMLGRIFENLLEDNKDKGAFYTPKEIVQYMCRESLISYLQTDEKKHDYDIIANFVKTHITDKLSDELKERLDKKLCDVKVCDPAIGSGAFPMGLLRELFLCRGAIENFDNAADIKKHIIQNNIYGVDVEHGAVDIARLRFWLSLVVDETTPHSLPNLDFKIMQGNSLLESYQGVDLSTLTYQKKGKENTYQMRFFDSETDIERRTLSGIISRYYDCADHAQKEEIMEQIVSNVNKQIELQNYNVDLSVLNIAANDQFFLWHTWFSDVFNRPSKCGFDIVIGNPPYIEAKKLKYIANILKRFYNIYSGTADLSIYFIELGLSLLKPAGVLSYITTNKFFNTGYGQKVRELVSNKEINKIINFEQVEVFEGILVSSVILEVKKVEAFTSKKITYKKFYKLKAKQFKESFIKHQQLLGTYPQCVLNGNEWSFADTEGLLLKAKIENGSQRLEDIDGVKINRGVTTGYNLAFIISNEQKELLLLEDSNNQRVIKNMLQGRNVRRWFYNESDENLIFTRRGINIEDYPSINKYLLPFKNLLKPKKNSDEKLGRKPGTYKWFEILDNTVYYKEFEKPEKIIWGLTADKWAFALDTKQHYLPSNGYILTSECISTKYILGMLNSKLLQYYFNFTGIMTAGGAYTLKAATVSSLPFKIADDIDPIIAIVDEILQAKAINHDADVNSLENKLNTLVYNVYEMSEDDISIIECK